MIQNIKNLIAWFPVIWKDRDWDRYYLYNIMIFKLNKMEKFFNSNKTFTADAKERAKEIKI